MIESPEMMAKVLNYYNIDYTQEKVICPFHGDINPSMSIDLAKSRVYCFGCQRSYSAIEFIKAVEPELNDLQLYKRLAEIQNNSKNINLNLSYKKNNFDVEQSKIQAEDYYFNLPKTNWLTEWSEESEYLLKRGFKPKTLNNSGTKININNSYSVIFPIYDNGQFVGWVCRTIKKEIEAKRKYLYNFGFRRSNTVCGRYDNKSPLIIVEGFFDMLKIRQFGYNNVVALLGWKMSDGQLKKIKDRGIIKIVSALDNDVAGEEGNKYLQTLGFKKIMRWPYTSDKNDPGEYSEKELKNAFEWLDLLVEK